MDETMVMVAALVATFSDEDVKRLAGIQWIPITGQDGTPVDYALARALILQAEKESAMRGLS